MNRMLDISSRNAGIEPVIHDGSSVQFSVN